MYLLIYNIAINFFLPLTLLKLIYRGCKDARYLSHWNERYGIYPSSEKRTWETRKTIWFHCVSVGETNAISSTLKYLIKKYPKANFLISHGTPTGRAVNLPKSKRIHRCYLPYDSSFAIRRFIAFYKPKLALINEKEIWPNLIFQCNKNKIPIFLVNARMSKRSVSKYLLFKSIFNKILLKLNGIYAQTKEDKFNFNKITQSQVSVMGNSKYDNRPPPNIKNKIKNLKAQLKIKNQFIIVAGSTRDGEENIIIDLMLSFKLTNFTLILVPRHPERFNKVANILKYKNLEYSRRSKYKNISKAPQFIIGDSMGELYEYYGLANFIIMGGSILDFGSQNPIEPISMNVPTAIGTSIYNFKNVIKDAEKAKAIIRFKELDELQNIIKAFSKSKSINQEIIQNTKTFMSNSKGGTKKILKIISQYF
jgi:3-deoxy-D-manno-octulosonic-acid transferase